MLRLIDGTIGHGKHVLLQNASLSLRPGEIKGLVAPNGYGKTTLMRVLSGRYKALKGGSVAVNRIVMKGEFTRPDVVYIPGDASMLYANLTVLDHLKMAHDLWESSMGIAETARLWAVEDFLKKPVRALSQGMKQQTSLAVASLCGAKYLLLDEPTNALDPINAQRSVTNFKSMAAQGTGILISSHILGTIDALCNSIAFIRDKGLYEVENVADAQTTFNEFYGVQQL